MPLRPLTSSVYFALKEIIAMTEQTSLQLQYEQKMAYFDERLLLYRQVIGGWPTNLGSVEQEREIRFLWQTDYAHAASLLQEHPQDIAVKLVAADLLRMGHNIGIPDAAKNADLLLNEIFRVDDTHLQAMICRASMYVSLRQELIPDAERLFTRALELTYPYVPPEVYQGLGFACLHQNKNMEAVTYFEKYLKLALADSKIKDLVAKLKAGEISETAMYSDPGLEAGNAVQEEVFKPMKPWWKFW